ncbi:gamma-secretase subunit APH-1A-like isoform X2 [Petromyzon marinus]|uniref:gamma-secretase subunit APH-1A-like isoform X2 n=1 Tax=Petromyzon marinus TaxID=7757 RepID=UPI003F722092
MSLGVFFGCTFIAFGPALALFVLTVAADPVRVIILIAGSFFWLVSLLVSSLVWFVVSVVTDRTNVQLQQELLTLGVFLSVCLQELSRFGYYCLLSRAERGLASINMDGQPPITTHQMAYAAGLGYGLVSGAFSVVNTLAQAAGPGTVGIHGDSQYYFLSSAFMTMALVLLHTFWGVVFFHGCEKRRWVAVSLVVGSHFLVSGLVGHAGHAGHAGTEHQEFWTVTWPGGRPC